MFLVENRLVYIYFKKAKGRKSNFGTSVVCRRKFARGGIHNFPSMPWRSWCPGWEDKASTHKADFVAAGISSKGFVLKYSDVESGK